MRMSMRVGAAVAAAVGGAALLLAAGSGSPSSGQERPEVTVTNIEVPVRVFSEGRFVEGLKASDFEIYEGGRVRPLQGFYYIRAGAVQGGEAFGPQPPVSTRTIALLFQVQDYHPRFVDLIEDLFRNVLRPGDTLSLQTPFRTYVLARQAFEVKSRDVLIEEMARLLRNDIQAGSGEFNSQFIELRRIARSIADVNPLVGIEDGPEGVSSVLRDLLPRYRESVERMESSRIIDPRKFLAFAARLKAVGGRTSVFLVYQREYRPELQQVVVNRLMSDFQDAPDLLADIQELFLTRRRETSFEVEPVQRAFSDALIDFHFIYMNKEYEYVPGIEMRESSEEYFRAFSVLARATGGTVDTSQNPAVGFRTAAESADSYYLLYFEPEDVKRDGTFHRIAVRVKDPSWQVVYRTGFYAD
ncbi:MAG: VWA domain-containing protein [Candidatus Aminicenantes bacterium]|nr:VWA domain-containing protein [Candidatus Aminicenantes bacterium]